MLQLLNFEGNGNNVPQNPPPIIPGNNANNMPQVNLSLNQKSHNKYFSAIDFYKPNNEMVTENNKKDVNLPKVKIIDKQKKLNSSLDNIDETNMNLNYNHNNNNNVNNNINIIDEIENSPIQPKV